MKKISLYYRDATSDKVYHVQLVGDGGEYRVNFQYGRRGGTLAEGTKTPIPVSLALAENIFAKLVKEKTGKGYTEGPDGTPYGGDATKLAEVLPKPQKKIVTLGQACGWQPGTALFQRKYDGEFTTRQVGAALLLGELVRPKSGGFFTASDRALLAAHGSFFAAVTVAAVGGQDYLSAPTRVRTTLLRSISLWPADCIMAETIFGGGEIKALLAAGGEGVCAHDWDSIWGPMEVIKALGTWRCRVTATGATQSVEVCDAVTGEPRGNVKLGGGKCDRVRVGSIVKIEGMGLTDEGKIREPRPCADTATSWLVSY